MVRRIAVVALAFAGVVVGQGVLADFEPPPPPDPQRRKGGESFPPGPPPLPGPVTPLRRTEKKRPPAPPALLGKVRYGKPVWKTTDDGRRFSYHDWASDTSDAHYLVETANAKLNVNYREIELSLDGFSFSPSETPILYITGHEEFAFSEEEVRKLRSFLTDGGYLIGDACCGAAKLSEAFRREMGRVFPDRHLKRLPPDHPLFHSFYGIDEVTTIREGKTVKGRPALFGIELGCRLAVLLFPDDVSCGWARHVHPQGSRIQPEDAVKLGVNFITLALASYQYGQLWSTRKVYFQKKEQTREEFVIGQVIHTGDWDPAPSAIAKLLRYVGENSTVDVQFKRADVDLAKADVFKQPVLYMTGHDDFELQQSEITALRSYLTNGGVLIADACCGREAFDAAFRRELRRVFPDKNLERLPLNHQIFSACTNITTVEYTEPIRERNPGWNEPYLEAITVGGVAAVIYSKYAIGAGWQGFSSPFTKGYAPADALRLGLNIITYAMTH